jgi:hypothetical protein
MSLDELERFGPDVTEETRGPAAAGVSRKDAATASRENAALVPPPLRLVLAIIIAGPLITGGVGPTKRTPIRNAGEFVAAVKAIVGARSGSRSIP